MAVGFVSVIINNLHGALDQPDRQAFNTNNFYHSVINHFIFVWINALWINLAINIWKTELIIIIGD